MICHTGSTHRLSFIFVFVQSNDAFIHLIIISNEVSEILLIMIGELSVIYAIPLMIWPFQISFQFFTIDTIIQSEDMLRSLQFDAMVHAVHVAVPVKFAIANSLTSAFHKSVLSWNVPIFTHFVISHAGIIVVARGPVTCHLTNIESTTSIRFHDRINHDKLFTVYQIESWIEKLLTLNWTSQLVFVQIQAIVFGLISNTFTHALGIITFNPLNMIVFQFENDSVAIRIPLTYKSDSAIKFEFSQPFIIQICRLNDCKLRSLTLFALTVNLIAENHVHHTISRWVVMGFTSAILSIPGPLTINDHQFAVPTNVTVSYDQILVWSILNIAIELGTAQVAASNITSKVFAQAYNELYTENS